MIHFPFSAIVGQAQLKTALLLCAVDPSLGGVLIRGDKGTAKSTAARALTDVLPSIARVPGCAFNCAPGAPCVHCEVCLAPDATAQFSNVPFITLPLGATEDRVLGTLDLARALAGAERAFQAGLLASAHRGILYIDEVNLLADHLVDVLLDVAAMGVNSVQREGLSIQHPARFTLVGTMNLEEGDLRPQLLDRFGLMVEVTAPREKPCAPMWCGAGSPLKLIQRRMSPRGPRRKRRFKSAWPTPSVCWRTWCSTTPCSI